MKNKDLLPHFFEKDIYTKCMIAIALIITLWMKELFLSVYLFLAFILSFVFDSYLYHRSLKKTEQIFENLSVHIGENESMPGFPFPAISFSMNGKITWYNSLTDKIMNGELLFQKNIKDIVKDFDVSASNENGMYPVYITKINDIFYSVYAHKVPARENEAESIVSYFLDSNEFENLKDQHEKNQFVSMSIAFDNYEEVTQGLDDEVRSVILTSVERAITTMATEINGIFKKIERDRYSISLSAESLRILTEKKFPILDKVREIKVSNSIAPTLSIGVGLNGKTFLETDSFSRNAMDVALGRGGDQVVIKTDTSMQYFGGKTREVEKRTKVKARVVAFAIRELILQSDTIFITGHNNADVDCVGASMGIVAIVRSLGKKSYIVLNEYDDTSKTVIAKAKEEASYKDVFITRASLDGLNTNNAVLFIMDTNSLSYLQNSDLLGFAEHVVLIDHHRRSGNFISNTSLAYHEPYASSTCEMVTEMLSYISDDNILLKVEAEALYAGIYLDTKSFTFKTGVRTLDAAAFLRRSGIDPVVVKQFFKTNLETFTMRASLIQGAKVYYNHIAISIDDKVYSPSLVAQAADELLNISGIDTSFVIARDQTNCIISARSTGEINVQIIMEKLGGGGHFSVAGAQIKGSTPKEVHEQLLKILEEYKQQK